MSSAGNRGIISNNTGTNWRFGRGGSSDGGDGPTGSTAERRRSSASSAQKFAKLHNQKRNSTDASATARKASFADQNKPPGFFGGMWQNFTKGK